MGISIKINGYFWYFLYRYFDCVRLRRLKEAVILVFSHKHILFCLGQSNGMDTNIYILLANLKIYSDFEIIFYFSIFCSWRKKLASLRSAQMAFQWSENPARAPLHTSGSSFSNCCKTKKLAPEPSNGQTEKKASLNLWTLRLSPGAGACTKTSQTWTMKLWDVLWGRLSLTSYYKRLFK